MPISTEIQSSRRYLVTIKKRTDGKPSLTLLQRPLLACSREIRTECLLSYYHHNQFMAGFNFWMGKFDMSELEHAARLLGPDLLRALFKRDIPSDPLFIGMQFPCASRLSIQIRQFDAKMTLAGFVHWAGLFFDGPLALEHFHNIADWKKRGMQPPKRSATTPTGDLNGITKTETRTDVPGSTSRP